MAKIIDLEYYRNRMVKVTPKDKNNKEHWDCAKVAEYWLNEARTLKPIFPDYLDWFKTFNSQMKHWQDKPKKEGMVVDIKEYIKDEEVTRKK